MNYLLDTADLEKIMYCNEFYPISGVTTNPSIIAHENTEFWGLLKEIRNIIGPEKMLCVQTVQNKADKIIQEAILIKEKVGEKFYIKVPISEEGLKATMKLKKMGVGVLVTAIFTPTQALIAAQAGADYVAPYVNRLDNIVGDGTEVVAQIVKQFKLYNIHCKVIAASFKSAQQVNKCSTAGCDCITLSADVLKTVITHPMTDSAIAGFNHDWQSVYGNKTILDL